MIVDPDMRWVSDVSTDLRGARLKIKRRTLSSRGKVEVGEVVPEDRGESKFSIKFTERTRLRWMTGRHNSA